jgi:hypothetical protein
VFVTHTRLLPSLTRRLQVYFELRAAHDRAGRRCEAQHTCYVAQLTVPVLIRPWRV